MGETNIKYVIFDLGGVVADWNPEYLYEKVFKGDREKMDWFLNTVCTKDWNMEQDAGRTFEEGTHILLKTYPEYESEIRMFFDRWEEMLRGEIKDNEKQIRALYGAAVKPVPADVIARFLFYPSSIAGLSKLNEGVEEKGNIANEKLKNSGGRLRKAV